MSIVISATVVFVLVWLVVRIVGKRELSELSAFDFVILVVVGDLVAEGVISEDTSVTGAVVAVATIALLTVGTSWLSWKLPRRRSFFEGVPTLLVRDGRIIHESLRIERLDEADLLAAARTNGIEHLEDVKWAVLEQDGSFSFFADEKRS
ncbi:YetF domain-containing protein [Aeromicrobium sp. IC_218]|uniref:DUF421 domain-containing protein n=1 Tax=Aeromicrobium sp. IC_218 TaxID=2545468 RepID=UPI00103C252E|nr:YetF domain-containing protein [Aeromicrobium sp. IC_218]TCI98738.1 DUF421 domain-containing protein [Aeromicrobium sp. IC_218]